jgi:hypothetical protein
LSFIGEFLAFALVTPAGLLATLSHREPPSETTLQIAQQEVQREAPEANRSGQGQGSPPECDAKCDAISADRIELLARAVVLVAGMRIPESAMEAVLARVTAELANTSEQRPPKSERAGESAER